MKTFICSCTLLFLFLISAQTVGAAEGAAYRDLPTPSLLNSLRQGGFILFVRHGEATVGDDQTNLDFNDCATQKNLSEVGKRQALLFGELLRTLHIPIQTPVQASPFCRTRESAALAFGVGNVQVNPFWFSIYKLSGSVTPAEKERIIAALTSSLEKAPPSGTNQVIVAHSFPKEIGLGEIPYMGTVVVKPKGQGNGYEVVGKVTLTELSGLKGDKP